MVEKGAFAAIGCTLSTFLRNLDQRNGLVPEAAIDLEIREIDCEHPCARVLLAQPNDRSVREIGIILSHELGNYWQVGNRIDPEFPRFEQQAQAFHASTIFAQAVRSLGHNRFTGHNRQRQSGKNLCAPAVVLVGVAKPRDQRARVENRINRSLQFRKDWPVCA